MNAAAHLLVFRSRVGRPRPGRPNGARCLGGIALGVAVAWLLAAPAFAETLSYDFEIPDRREVVFEISFATRHAGSLAIEASWDAARILSFRIEDLGSTPARWVRSGPSPQRFRLPAPPPASGAERTWRMTIRALPARGGGVGALTIATPEPDTAPPPTAAAVPPVAVPPEPQEAWARARRAPRDAPDDRRKLFDSVEAFRSAVVTESGEFRPDACSWHGPFLRYAAVVRDRDPVPPSAPRDEPPPCARRLAAAVRRVDDVRTSTDPDLAGPPPDDPTLRLEWKARRGEKIRPLEAELDEVLQTVRGDGCPELAGERWPSRFVACLTACERHFDERGRAPGEASSNEEMTRDQWPFFLAAAAVLEAMAGPPVAPSPETAREP